MSNIAVTPGWTIGDQQKASVITITAVVAAQRCRTSDTALQPHRLFVKRHASLQDHRIGGKADGSAPLRHPESVAVEDANYKTARSDTTPTFSSILYRPKTWSPITAQPVPTEEQWQHIDLSPYIQAGPRSIEFGPGPSAPPPEAGNTYGLANAHDFVSLNPQTTPPMQTPTTGNMLQQAVASPPVPQNIPFNVPTNTLYQMAMPCLISSGDVRRITIVHSRGTDHIMACFDFTKPEGFIDEGFVESCHLSRHPFPTDWRGRGNRGHGNRGWVNLVVTSIENVASLGRPQIRIPLNVRAGNWRGR
ncbi:hypothetical protein B0I35DRAFT_411056 [Stachybotrys elegans]|uniref:Uncharacterized protein n=1 Tax=Stachybotrys elegans TaxID=80388 RepID=A0A8K0WNA8_9HYPO|nr:hypothetical protein B0I35DRAFT_411056 [Stachybotrys elegans]